ncbi:hypothetical protein KP509_34G032400 [Ceratopteris richardii]|uniref:Cellulose synthase-like protein D2 n=1 Tax=Ceratopteris richardii TaxID=49495 RepID=A0A8T2QK17_CERRI|nr:hypothetical protein KP509_34G032400 [Ceratopteris richardii]
MNTSSLQSNLSRAVGRSFRNAGISSSTLPKVLSPASSYSGKRTSSGRYVPLSGDDHDASGQMTEMEYYHVHVPPTPDNQPMIEGGNAASVAEDVQIGGKGVPHAVSDTMYTGGFQSMTRGRLLHRMIDGEALGNAPVSGFRDGGCAMEGCDGNVMRDDRGANVYPCECMYPLCRDCYVDVVKAGSLCPGCKELFKSADEGREGPAILLASQEAVLDRRLSVLRSTKTMAPQNHGPEHSPWLYESKATYGYGNALKPQQASYDGGEGSESFEDPFSGDSKERMLRPLSRKVKIRPTILGPYRLIVLIRLIALAFFLSWRVRNPNRDAMWLWGMSVVCEIWFAFSWVLDQLPKLKPINRSTDLEALRAKFEMASAENPLGRSDLPGVDFFVSTADPEKEPVLVTANTVLSILAVDYPVEKVACYISDDGGSLLTFEAIAEAASFARNWVPFCRKHAVEPRNPESYFSTKGDPTKNQVRHDFVKDRRRLKREYDEFKVRINNLPDVIRRRSDACNAREEIKAKRAQLDRSMELLEKMDVPKATWMADATHWPGTWSSPSQEHSRGDHAGIIQVMLRPPSSESLYGGMEDDSLINMQDVDVRLPMLVYVSREKRPGYDHNKKAGAMNALVRASAIMSNGPFILNLDCDHYIYNSQAVREGMCFMLGSGGENVCYVQFPQRFEGIDPRDRYANHNTVFFDGNMRALDGLQGPMYVGTGCMFRRVALYGFDPPLARKYRTWCCHCCGDDHRHSLDADTAEEDDEMEMMNAHLLRRSKKFGGSEVLLDSIPRAEKEGRPLAGQAGVHRGRQPGLLTAEREPLTTSIVAEAISAISCWYEDKTEWGHSVGWIYGSVTEDVVTGYRMHNRGWHSVYCITKRDAFRGTAPINLTDRLHQVLRWATGSVEIFFSRNNGLLSGPHMKFLQRIAYLNVGIYPFTSIFLLVYCFLPALSLFSNQFIVQTLNMVFLIYLLVITICLCLLAMLEVKWSGITLEEWWRNEQFWLIGGTSAHLAAVLQGLLKVVAGIDISFTLTSKSAGEDADDEFADLYIFKWTSLMIPPLTIMMVNIIAIAVAFARTIYSSSPEWSKLLGGTFFSLWVLLHLYPFAKGLMGRRGRTPTIIFVWAGLVSITISLLWVAISNPSSNLSSNFQL